MPNKYVGHGPYHFAEGGTVREPTPGHVKKELSFMKDKGAPKSMIAAEKKEHGFAPGKKGVNPFAKTKFDDGGAVGGLDPKSRAQVVQAAQNAVGAMRQMGGQGRPQPQGMPPGGMPPQGMPPGGGRPPMPAGGGMPPPGGPRPLGPPQGQMGGGPPMPQQGMPPGPRPPGMAAGGGIDDATRARARAAVEARLARQDAEGAGDASAADATEPAVRLAPVRKHAVKRAAAPVAAAPAARPAPTVREQFLGGGTDPELAAAAYRKMQGGIPPGMAKGGSIDGCAQRGKTRAR